MIYLCISPLKDFCRKISSLANAGSLGKWLCVSVTVSFRPGAAVNRNIEHVGSRRTHYIRAVSETEDEDVGEAGGNLQGRSAPTGETEIPLPVNVAVQ